MSEPRKFDFREWMVPPVLVPIFMIVLIVIAGVVPR